MDASRVGRRELLMLALMNNAKGLTAWCPPQVSWAKLVQERAGLAPQGVMI